MGVFISLCLLLIELYLRKLQSLEWIYVVPREREKNSAVIKDAVIML